MAGFPATSAEYTGDQNYIDITKFYVTKPNLSNQYSGKIKLCSATWEASALVTTENHIFTFGYGSRGELGRGSCLVMNEGSCPPLDRAFIPEGATITDLASGLHHTIIVLSNGEVYGWGNGRKGQLGDPAEMVLKPRRIDAINFRVERAVCGREFTYLVGEQNQGQHTILGSDKYCIRSQAPESASGWKNVGASWGTIFVLHQSGKIISWGRNDHGQLASGHLPPIAKMAVGSEHVVALTACGKVLAWGWGEHGNCGADVDKDGDAKSPWSEIKTPNEEGGQTIIGVGAGCATSWLWTDTACLPFETLSKYLS
ncbi:hypothetical protein MMC11_002851 [Xylographa trunciseda]|nr:hypothetical protein [Xylographa trunciseda]